MTGIMCHANHLIAGSAVGCACVFNLSVRKPCLRALGMLACASVEHTCVHIVILKSSVQLVKHLESELHE